MSFLDQLTFDPDDADSIRGDYFVLRDGPKKVLLHKTLVGLMAGAFARRYPLAAAPPEEGLEPFRPRPA